ncbi:hypothetical protein KQI41_14755 [Tissierella pigra]|uniref:methyl-accepting chemotaxis protein n=1 Tax=Tissierella pigra TaxID=2607614 RepID=UPI001C0FA454|nr:methyl-accepting chemotaxis protein [Tissierella pigra]MBU5427647.1 hypothetical protein [Tissierella pigra]
MKSKSIRRLLTTVILSLLLLAFVVSAVFTNLVLKEKSKNVLIEKAKEQVFEMAKQVEEILNNETNPIPELQKFVELKSTQDNVTYAIVIDKDVQAVAHSDIQKLNKVYEDEYTIDGAKHGKNQFTRWYAETQGIWTYDIMEPIYKNGELYGVLDIGVPESGIKSISTAVLFYQIIIGCGSFIVIGVLMWFIIDRIIVAITLLEGVIHQTAILDFTENPDLEVLSNRRDEIGSMAQKIISMRDSLKNVIYAILDTSEELTESARVLTVISGDTVRTTDEINSAISEIAKATEEQAHDTEKGAEQIGQLSKNIDYIIDSTLSIANMTKDIDKLSSEGVSIVSQLSEWSEKNKLSSQQVSTIVKEVDKTSSDISSIVSIITEIATQTNLLALNASIESARAGEAGKGFAVVAEEIRKLSEQTSKATGDIKNKIDAIQDISKNAVSEIETSLDIVKENVKSSEDTSEIFNTIKEALDKIIGVAKNVETLSREMNGRKEQIIIAIENISASAEETSAGTEQVSASAYEQLGSIEMVSEKAKGLNDVAELLQNEMKKFKLSETI